ncbi:Alpha-ketoglutarate-dependent dioxygenase alkB homolog 3 (Alkylated DNA repair protein alkB homolog 3) (mAbh3) [Durusdinium trenchii]|uniref:Alpha-ketoglutarate-dependent dioxygenase alkB homolog 3 (Alkylated DNA repair protein alkB homolog 3) (MAbh3) n=1 Tax=Durusdinium trenchii TaxID=1381693 RepID=A0ABP0QCS2_9DINO
MEGASADRKDVRSQRVKAILESNCGKEPLEIANILTRKYHELYSESAPDEMVCAPEGCRSDHHVEGPEAGRHHGVIIRWVSGEWLQWRSDGGIYVGDGSKRLTASPLGQANRDRLDTRVARRLLEGRPLYIDEGDSLEMAQSTVDYFGLRGGTGQGPRHGGREYYQQVEAFLEGAMTTLQLGIVLKEMVRVRPSLLGTAVILMELCAVGPLGSSQPFQEVLPLPLPDDTEAEIEVRRVLEKVRLGQPEAGSKESLDNWVPVAGVDAWVWLQVVLLNYMYIGKDRLLTQTLFHSKTLLECQVPVMEKLKWNARTFGNSGESVRIGPWHDVSEQLGELYTGKEWRKCYPLTLRAIEPSIPKAGEAARVELASVLPERIREYAVNPALVRQFWLRGLALISGKDLTIEEKNVGEEDAHAEVHFEACWPALWKFVEPATARLCDTDDPFPCFTRPIKREQPPPSPAGLEQASEKALRRWKGDAYRLPPYAYEDACLVKDKGGPRRLKAMEQARMLGYNSGHFRNMKPKPTEDEVGGFTGNSFPVIVVGRLLMGLITPSPPDQQQNYVELLWKAWDAHEEVALQSQKVLAEMRAEQRAISSSVDELHSEVLEFTAELKQAQALSSTRLVSGEEVHIVGYGSKRSRSFHPKCEMSCSTNFKEEATEHRPSQEETRETRETVMCHASEALRQQRAQLRREAVELGKKLQACVSQADALVSENLRLRTESAELEEAFSISVPQTGFCGTYDLCEFGRDEDFCSSSCYIGKGIEALDWDTSEAACWLGGEGLDRWKRQLVSVLRDGHALLTTLNEGVLRRVGVPKRKAKEVMQDVEDLRRGAWSQPEPPLKEVPLVTVAEMGERARPGLGWHLVLKDDSLRSYASLCRNAVPQDMAWSWFEQLRTQLPWQDLSDSRYQEEGKYMPRRTIFTVFNGCNCTYKYSGVAVKPTIEPPFVARIRLFPLMRGVACAGHGEYCVAASGLATQPNCCNINLYRDGRDSVGWHTDDEELFEGGYNDICILSLSLGATRTFEVKHQPGFGVARGSHKGPAETSFAVRNGDLCTMEGKFQRHYLHAVPKEPQVRQARINLTWRWITKHNQVDGCPLCGPGNSRAPLTPSIC